MFPICGELTGGRILGNYLGKIIKSQTLKDIISKVNWDRTEWGKIFAIQI